MARQARLAYQGSRPHTTCRGRDFPLQNVVVLYSRPRPGLRSCSTVQQAQAWKQSTGGMGLARPGRQTEPRQISSNSIPFFPRKAGVAKSSSSINKNMIEVLEKNHVTCGCKHKKLALCRASCSAWVLHNRQMTHPSITQLSSSLVTDGSIGHFSSTMFYLNILASLAAP
jgi:hypothetical protein